MEAGAQGDCASCHAANITAFHSGAGSESQTVHDLHTDSGYFSACQNCHGNRNNFV